MLNIYLFISDDVDDDVSGHYIRGSKSPPGIANHLLRSAVTNHAGIKVRIIYNYVRLGGKREEGKALCERGFGIYIYYSY